MEALSSLFFFHIQHAASEQDTTAPPMSVSLPASVDAYKVAETEPDNCWKPTVWRSVEAADRWSTGMCVIKGREGESVPGQSGCDQGVAAPLCRTYLTDGSQLDVRVWLSGLEGEPSGNSADIIQWLYT